MVDKINVTPLGTPPDDGSFSFAQPEFEACYASLMDSSFAALGRTITLHLTPIRVIDASGVQASTGAVQYNPFMGRSARPVPSTISTTRQPAVKHTYRDVEYVAHVRHGPKPVDETGGDLLLTDEVQTTTVLASLQHINECESVTIDGRRYVLDSTRQIGLQNARYVISKWKIVNEVEA